MKIILIESLSNLGKMGDVLCVKSGYARNFLIPYGKAIIATAENIEFEKAKKEKIEKELMKKFSIAQSIGDKIKQIKSIIIPAKVGIEGKLFGSIGSRDIAKKLFELSDIKINKQDIHFLDGVLRNVGRHNVIFKPHHNISVTIEVNVVPSK